ncbi:MAG: methyltransferase, TrmH family, group 3 [Firmicutes bacterium]|nr:methyltransferase, TrmH family, group 3 [Bacillota bacterium]
MADDYVAGRNSVMEALKGGRTINKLLVSKGERQGSLKEIVGLARAKGLVVQEVEQGKLDSLAEGVRHQGVVAMVAPVAYVELEDILAKAKQQGEPPFLVLLDEIEDPHNVGAILRTAEAAGVHGVLIPKRRSCPLSATVAKTSAGAVEYVPVARIGNVAQTLERLKKAGLWVIGADMDGQKSYYQADLKGPVLLVVGSEGRGLSRLTKEACDFLVKIPMVGKVSSLNASVACSLLLYEIFRQREEKV